MVLDVHACETMKVPVTRKVVRSGRWASRVKGRLWPLGFRWSPALMQGRPRPPGYDLPVYDIDEGDEDDAAVALNDVESAEAEERRLRKAIRQVEEQLSERGSSRRSSAPASVHSDDDEETYDVNTGSSSYSHSPSRSPSKPRGFGLMSSAVSGASRLTHRRRPSVGGGLVSTRGGGFTPRGMHREDSVSKFHSPNSSQKGQLGNSSLKKGVLGVSKEEEVMRLKEIIRMRKLQEEANQRMLEAQESEASARRMQEIVREAFSKIKSVSYFNSCMNEGIECARFFHQMQVRTLATPIRRRPPRSEWSTPR